MYYGAFLDLGTSRNGLGDGPIPWREIETYARLNGFSEEQTQDLHFHIIRMDEVFLEHQKKKQ